MDPDNWILLALIVENLAFGLGCAVPLAGMLCRTTDRSNRFLRYFIVLVGVYFLECIAFSAGMATQVFTVGLAFVWGIVLGLWLRNRSSVRETLRTSFFFALYTCLPTVSLCVLVPALSLVSGGHILSAEEGIGFGIPDFLPFPLNTILGFFGALVTGTIVLKTVITTGAVRLFVRCQSPCQG